MTFFMSLRHPPPPTPTISPPTVPLPIYWQSETFPLPPLKHNIAKTVLPMHYTVHCTKHIIYV